MKISLYDYQKKAVEQMKTGSILFGGVGSGKSRTSLAYFYTKECGGLLDPFSEPKNIKPLYIITTARKRDTFEWDEECSRFLISKSEESKIPLVIDSWNNITKYDSVKDVFFIFDEQRLVGSGTWVKSFLKIAKYNKWILLSATPGDTWMDYIPVFIANGFYRNRTEFIRRHVIYNRFTKFPKVDRYVDTYYLEKLRESILVNMNYIKSTKQNHINVLVSYDISEYRRVYVDRWNIFKDLPIKDVSDLCYSMRRVVNSSTGRIDAVKELIKDHPKVIIFYNFNYELELLIKMCEELKYSYSQWNGHKHEPIPRGKEWVYLVQYTAGAEGWNCVLTDCIIFFSQNYSYKIMKQSAGRIDRLNTPYEELYYYHLITDSPIDNAISTALKQKKTFNEKAQFSI